MNTFKWIGAAIIALVLGGVAVFQLSPDINVGAVQYERIKKHYYGGLFIGSSDEVNFGSDGVATLATTTAEAFTQGGSVVTVTPVTTSVTLTEAQMLRASVITFTASSTQGALTVTLPATSTMTSLLANAGDYRSWVIENPFTGSATTTTVAAGSGIDLQEPDGQNVVIGINNYAWLTCFREASTDVVCRVDETIPAD